MAASTSLAASKSDHDDLGKLLLRITIALLLLFHGVAKVVGGTESIGRALSAHGLPPAIANLVFLGEIVAPLLMLAGIAVRLASAVVAVNMVIAVLLFHSTQLTGIGRTGGWLLELQMFYLAVAISLLLFGPGRYRLWRPGSWWAQ